jgi:glutathione S-transferase
MAHGAAATEAFIEKGPDPLQRERRRAWIEQGYDAPGVAGALKTYDKALSLMEKALAGGPWLAGGTFSLADIGLIPYVNRLDMLSMSRLWNGTRPRLADWFSRVKARSSFEPAIFEHMPAVAREDMLRNGAIGGPELLKSLS